MAQKAVYSRLNVRIAEEKQLLAEEKWIIDALTKIRKQRNCLQIERLELENLNTQLMMNSRAQQSPQPASTSISTQDAAVKMMASNTAAGVPLQDLEQALVNELNDAAFCNEQELDLTVTNPILRDSYKNLSDEEVESDGSEDSHDESNSVFIDMNMFMNGVTSQKSE